MSPDLRSPITAPAAATLQRRLLAWYDAHRRDLPWRRTRDPYPVWLSEVMLQQTQVATARPYYDAFLVRFPTLAALARAKPAEVLDAWAGLGYYRRARHLHEAAQTVMREHAGRVPDDPEAFGRLPGVGRYTRGAVLSICFDRPLPVLDGNVARVLARLFAVPAAIRDPRGARRLWALADVLVPMRRPGDWNQAVMELGATLCTPRAPACGRCPLRKSCRALAMGRVEEFPPAAQRRATETVCRAVALIARGGRVLMARREGPLLTGLWEPPGVELTGHASPVRALRPALARLGLKARLAPAGRTVRHTITHRAITVEVWRGTLTGAAPRRAGLRWVDPARPGVPLTALARRLTRAGAE
ncbi:MAG: A/G-specific adenine glycosylase [Candidatus Eisenbacteria bacterium]|uniref:Adenine DNA glycosylase n=1 Tax=Eiseniibacteriota bacterium TaxID=2212470 RepID=A0A538UDB5_UNCEI|nr:MAG: A/G-specific adenine glycosylase [Candidatus Eisenbacteria bacterium]